MNKSLLKLCTLSLVIAAVVLGGCEGGLKKPRVLVYLPDTCNTPDGATLDAKGNIIFSCPNFNNNILPEGAPKQPAVMMKLDKQDKLTEFCTPPVHPETKQFGPMGLDFGPDGHLYVADNQWFTDKDYKSRLVRIKIADGKPVGYDVVVEGLRVANAVIWRKQHVYVSDTVLAEAKPLRSGIFRFSLAELKADKPVQLKRDGKDPHLIAEMLTHGEIGFGADGLTFDPDGNLYCGNFGDGTIQKITFDKDGKVKSNEVWCKSPKMKCCDGIFYDKRTNRIYVADMVQNAVQAVTLDGKVTTIVRNGDTTGADGGLDQPCEVIVRGDELIVVNMDMPFDGIVNTKFDKPYTLSVVKLPKPKR